MATLFDGIGANGFSSGFAAGNAVREMKEKQARQKGLASGFTKVLNGDNTGWQEMANADPVATMNAWNAQKALEQKNIENKFGVGTAKGETLQAMALLNDPNTPPELKQQLKQFVDVRTKVPEVVYNTTYQATLGKKKAEQGVQDQKNEQESEIRLNKIDDTIENVEKNKNLLTPTAPVSDFVGALTQGNYGMSDEDRITRGELVRQVSDIKNDLIARAKQHGQSGINTAAEIDRATAGIDSGDYAKLIGALRALKSYEQKVIGLENGMSVVGTTPEQAEQEIVDYTSYFGG